jgi:RND family efflux transporter MFP subunit
MKPSQVTANWLVSCGMLAIMFVTFSTANTYADDKQNRRSIQLRSASLGDEAFTEPIETIQVACSEFGIIGNVNVKRGQVVEADQLLFELDMSVLKASLRLAQAKANSKASRRAAEVEFETKSTRYEKLVRLISQKAGSPQEVERAKADVEVARQNVEAIIEEIEQYSLESQRIESQMERRRVRSPIAGVVIDTRKKKGEYVANSDPHLATVVQLDTLRVVFYLPTSRAAKIKSGHDAEILLTETNQKAKGSVEYVAPITNADSGRVRVEVLIENANHQYRSGVRCRLLETSVRQSMNDPIFMDR